MRDAGAGGERRVNKGSEARQQCGHQPGPHLPWAAAAPRGPGSGTGDPRRSTWRTGARPPPRSHPWSQPAGLEVEQETAPLSGASAAQPPQACPPVTTPLATTCQTLGLGGLPRVTSSWLELGSEPVCRACELSPQPIGQEAQLRPTWAPVLDAALNPPPGVQLKQVKSQQRRPTHPSEPRRDWLRDHCMAQAQGLQ